MKTLIFLSLAYWAAISFIETIWGEFGLVGDFWTTYTVLKMLIYMALMGHITITCMSLSFHRHHTHKGVIFNKVLDFIMQTWLILVTGMSKLDWVSIHLYHHSTSDTAKDPHSPVHKGFWRVFLFGVYDYIQAKSDPMVIKIKSRLPVNKFEAFYDKNPLIGLITLTCINLVLFGPLYGSIISLINFSISPLFAVGGVNAVAHMWGYRNHQSNDNSRNIGFLFPINWIICGELDHNNHHAYQKSCSFRHKWYEFDIGYIYINLLSWVKLAKVKVVYRPRNLQAKLKKQLIDFLETEKFSDRLEELANEFNENYEELKLKLIARVKGERKKLEPALEAVIQELQMMMKEMRQYQIAQ